MWKLWNRHTRVLLLKLLLQILQDGLRVQFNKLLPQDPVQDWNTLGVRPERVMNPGKMQSCSKESPQNQAVQEQRLTSGPMLDTRISRLCSMSHSFCSLTSYRLPGRTLIDRHKSSQCYALDPAMQQPSKSMQCCCTSKASFAEPKGL